MAEDIVAIRGNCDSEVDRMQLPFPIMSDYTCDRRRETYPSYSHGHIYNKEKLPPGHFDAVITGHTHRWQLASSDEGTLFCNTGSITFPKNGNPPTLATMEHGIITMYTLSGEKLAEAMIPSR